MPEFYAYDDVAMRSYSVNGGDNPSALRFEGCERSKARLATAGLRSSQRSARIPGYYCLFDTAFDRDLVSFWSGKDWQFLGTLHLTRDDTVDARGRLVMENYVIGDRIREPEGARRF
jgi:hypothetical protein